MCTAIYKNGYVGRNLDVCKDYGECVIITPRKYVLSFRKHDNYNEHYAMIGIGTVSLGYPLYFDAVNEHGLYMAGLNYVGNAKYQPPIENKVNIAHFELIPYILGKCKSVKEASDEFANINITDLPFMRDMPPAQLHFFLADKIQRLTVEPDQTGINIYDNPVCVLTNNPSFPSQMFNLNNYANLSPNQPIGTSFERYTPSLYSEGMGAIGLPGDLSSQSRFVRAAFHTTNISSINGLTSLFHLLASVSMPEGSVRVKNSYERTEYCGVVSLSTMTYYYRAYNSCGISSVRLFSENLDTSSLITYPVLKNTEPNYQN